MLLLSHLLDIIHRTWFFKIPITEVAFFSIYSEFWKKANSLQTLTTANANHPCFLFRFLSISGRFWRPRPPQKSSQNGQEIVRNALFGHLGRKPELGRPRGRNLDGFGSLRDRFWTMFGRFRDDFGTSLGRLLRNQTLKNLLWWLGRRVADQ